MLRNFYRGLKRNRLTSVVMQACDIIRPATLTGVSSPVYRRIISGHWVTDDYEKDSRDAFRKIVVGTGAKTFFDIGANAGIYVAEFCALVPSAPVVAIEPNNLVFSCLQRTCAEASTNAVSIHAAASDAPGFVTIRYNPLSPAMGGILPGDDGLYMSERVFGGFLVSQQVEAITVDEAVSRYFVPDIVKIDVEGAELLVFKGAKNLFLQRKPSIFFEFSQNKQEVSELIKSWGYVLFSENLQPLDYPEFATFALHRQRHAEFIRKLYDAMPAFPKTAEG